MYEAFEVKHYLTAFFFTFFIPVFLFEIRPNVDEEFARCGVNNGVQLLTHFGPDVM